MRVRLRRSERAFSTGVKIRSRKRSPNRSIVRSMRRISIRSEPIPTIMTVRPSCAESPVAPCLFHQDPHAADRTIEATENGLPDEEMPDIQFGDGRDGRDRADSIEIQAVTGMAFQADGSGMGGGSLEALQFRGAFRSGRLA